MRSIVVVVHVSKDDYVGYVQIQRVQYRTLLTVLACMVQTRLGTLVRLLFLLWAPSRRPPPACHSIFFRIARDGAFNIVCIPP